MKVTLQLQPLFKRAISYKTMKDDNLADRAVDFGYEHEFSDITWYPSHQLVVYRIDDRVSSDVLGDGLYDFIGFRATPTTLLAALRTSGHIHKSYMVNLSFLVLNVLLIILWYMFS